MTEANSLFKPAMHYDTGQGPSSVAIGDLNGDGYLDLAVANKDSNNVSVLLGIGDGNFQTAVNYTADDRPNSIAIGELNGNGDLDLAEAQGDRVLSQIRLSRLCCFSAVGQWRWQFPGRGEIRCW